MGRWQGDRRVRKDEDYVQVAAVPCAAAKNGETESDVLVETRIVYLMICGSAFVKAANCAGPRCLVVHRQNSQPSFRALYDRLPSPSSLNKFALIPPLMLM